MKWRLWLMCLNAPRSSRLNKWLNSEGRIHDNFTGDNTDSSINFVPVMDKNELLSEYNEIKRNIYSSKLYYERVLLFLKNYNPPFIQPFSFIKFVALVKSFIYLAIIRNNWLYYWIILFWCIFNKPGAFPKAENKEIYYLFYYSVPFRI